MEELPDAMAPPGDDFTEWVRPHLTAMANLATRMVGAGERDDVVQESLTRAWRRWSTFQSDRGTPRAWLLAIVADRSRRTRRRRHPADQFVVSGSAPAADIDLERAIAKLAPRQRLAVNLYYFVDLDIAETAVVMGCSEGTVKSTLADARTRLRAHLED